MSKINKVQLRNYKEGYSLIGLLPILFTLAVVPLIIFAYTDKVSDLEAINFLGSNEFIDVFIYYKSIGVIIAANLTIVIFAISYIGNGISLKRANFYIPTAIYGFFIIVSTLTSKYKDIALKGFAERYEGMVILISYLILLILTYNFVNSEKHLKYITIALAFSGSIICLLGLLQLIGYDFFESEFAKKVLYSLGENQKVVLPYGKYNVYSTLSNSNYVGSYVCLVLPIILFMCFKVNTRAAQIASAIISIALGGILLGSKSRAGFVGLVVIVFLMMIIFRKQLWQRKWIILGAAGVCIALTVVINIAGNGIITEKVVSALKLDVEKKGVTFDLKDIVFKDKSVEIIAPNETLKFNIDSDTLALSDENGEPLAIEVGEEVTMTRKLKFSDSKYKDYNILIDNSTLIINNKGMNLSFLMSDDGFYLVGSGKKLFNRVGHPETVGFAGLETLGSARGYIWSRTIPMLKDTIIIGYGPDTYGIKYPQDDFVGKLRAYNVATINVTKPHNLYLQIAVNTGVMSLLAVLILFGIYITQCIRLYVRKKIDTKKFTHVMGTGLFLGICGYLIAGLFNDSVVTVAPLFWVLLGVGFACNYLVKNEKAG